MTILILPTFILIIGAIIIFMQKMRRRFVFTVKITHWLLIGYIGLLLIAMAISTFITTELPKRAAANEGGAQDIYHDLSQGTIENIDPELIVQDQTFDYQNTSLTLSTNHAGGSLIYVERKATNDGKIVGYVYNSGLHVNGYYFSDKLAPIELKLENDTLTIHHPNQRNLKLAMVNQEFTINQFNRQQPNNKYGITGPDQEGIYLQVPRDLKIQTQHVNVIEVGE